MSDPELATLEAMLDPLFFAVGFSQNVLRTHLQLLRDLIHPLHTVTSELRHNDYMLFLRFRESSYSDIAVTDRFHFEDSAPPGDNIEGLVKSLEEDKDLCRFACRAPRCEASDVGEEDGAMREQVGNWLQANVVIG